MTTSLKLLLIFLILIFGLRVEQNGGVGKYQQDPELEAIEIKFEPIRDLLSKQSSYLLPQPQAALLSGMVVGDKSTLTKYFNNALKRTSTIHIVVVSGQNLTLLAGFILGFAKFFGRKKTLVVALVAISFYAILTGLQLPVIRAAIMVGIVFIAQLFNREANSFFVLIFTGLVMLIFDPNLLTSVSFQLSFLATIGVVVVSPEITKRLNLPDVIKQDLAVSIAAQALTLPVIAFNFHQASLIGVLTNSLVLWTVPIIMISGAIVLIFSFLNLALAQLLALIPGIFLTYFVYIVEFSNQNWAAMYVPKTNPLVWIGYYLIIVGLFMLLKQKTQSIDLEE